ncbi:MAG: hypothetical protein LBD41_04975 [Clostridiales Family XIII bacterium]|jgi:hypothetical protein|nr:hypothetical protein [Clostridiales Family XIII bacterium]
MNEEPVVTIIKLFDELDAYEAINLVELLAQRGYSLKIDRSHEVLEPDTGETEVYGLALTHFYEDYKIPTIKAIKSIHHEFVHMYTFCKSFTLREAKDFVELPASVLKGKPICTGTLSNLTIIKDSLSSDFPKVTFDIIKTKKSEMELRN